MLPHWDSTRARCISLPHRAPRVLWTSVDLSPSLNDRTIWAPRPASVTSHPVAVADDITEPFAPSRYSTGCG
jgi:hypothetical protein